MGQYTLHLPGGHAPFTLRLEGAIPNRILYQGDMVVMNVSMGEVMSSILQQFLIEAGFAKGVLWSTHTQSEEQEEERKVLLGIGQQDRVWPNLGCPQCYWFDPLVDSGCGRVHMLELEYSEKAEQDANSCVTPYIWRKS